MSTYFFVTFELYYIIFRYDVFLEEYMDLSPRLISYTKSKHIEPMRRTNKSESQKKKLNNNLTYSSIQQNTKLATTLLLQRIHVFSCIYYCRGTIYLTTMNTAELRMV